MEETEMIKAIKEEYEKKIAEIETKHKEELEKVRKEESDKAVSQIRAIISGRDDGTKEVKKNEDDDEEKDPYEVALNETRTNFGLKNNNKGEK